MLERLVDFLTKGLSMIRLAAIKNAP